MDNYYDYVLSFVQYTQHFLDLFEIEIDSSVSLYIRLVVDLAAISHHFEGSDI